MVLAAAVLLLHLAAQDAPDGPFDRLAALDPDLRAKAQAAFLKESGAGRDGLKAALPAPEAVIGLAFLGDPAAKVELTKLLSADRPALVRAAAEAAGFLNVDPLARELSKILEGEDLAAGMAAARSLARAKAPQIQRAVLALAQAPDRPRRKVLAAYALEIVGPAPEQLAILLAQAESIHPEAREAAWTALLNLPHGPGALRRRPEPQGPQAGTALLKLFREEAVSAEVRPLAGRLLVRGGFLTTAEVVELSAHERKEVAGWARTAMLDPELYRKCVVVATLLRMLSEREDAADETKEPVPALEEMLRAEGARGEGEKLKARVESYRAWWERSRIAMIDKDVNRAIDQGVAWLREKQQPDGSWKYCTCGQQGGDHGVGATALAVYTLLKCGAPLRDKAVEKGIEFLLSAALPNHTYTVSLEAMALSEAIELLQPEVRKLRADKSKEARAALAQELAAIARYSQRLRECAEWLVEAQTRANRGGAETGDWGYAKPASNDMDNSNTQFAVLGLRAAQNAGVPIPDRAWARSTAHWLHDQTRDGGWPYRKERDNPNQGGTRSMTAAGLYSTLVSSASLRKKDPVTLVSEPAFRKGMDWFKRSYPVPEPRRERAGGHVHSIYYDLYSVERAMMISRTEKLDGKDWYHDGALYLLANQERDGRWIDTTDTCFALLFLKKAYVAVATGDAR
jgi:hypothetical protein